MATSNDFDGAYRRAAVATVATLGVSRPDLRTLYGMDLLGKRTDDGFRARSGGDDGAPSTRRPLSCLLVNCERLGRRLERVKEDINYLLSRMSLDPFSITGAMIESLEDLLEEKVDLQLKIDQCC